MEAAQKPTGKVSPVVKNLPTDAGDTGLILIQEGPVCCEETKPIHNYWAQAPSACTPQQKPPQRGACSPQLEKAWHATIKTQCSQKFKKKTHSQMNKENMVYTHNGILLSL